MNAEVFWTALEQLVSQLPKFEVGADDKLQVAVQVDIPQSTREALDEGGFSARCRLLAERHLLDFEEAANQVTFRARKSI